LLKYAEYLFRYSII